MADFLVLVHPSVERDLRYLMSGRPYRRHRRAASVRGRKRALMASWRPTNG